MAVKHIVQPLSGLLLLDEETDEYEAFLSAELKKFLDSSDTRNQLSELILDDKFAQVSMVNEVGRTQAATSSRDSLVQPRPLATTEGHHLLREHRPGTTQSAIAANYEAKSSGACQGVSLLGISNEDKTRFSGLILFITYLDVAWRAEHYGKPAKAAECALGCGQRGERSQPRR